LLEGITNMRSVLRLGAGVLAAAALVCAQGNGGPNGNGKPSGRGNHLLGASTPGRSAGTTLLNDNGGPVMLGQTHVYYIYYGNWSTDPNAAGILANFANNLNGSGYYNILTQYYQGSAPNQSFVANSVSLAKAVTSTYTAANPTNLSDSDIQNIVSWAISHDGLPTDANGMYFVLTAVGVGESSGFLTQYCGWHTAAVINNTWIKYSFVGDAGNSSGCSVQFGSSPNGDPPVDAMISVIAHELSETVTDPLLNAWYDSSGYEIGDKCAWNFGSTYAAPNGSTANIKLGAYNFLVQQEFSNASDSCVMTYSANPDYSMSISPASQTAMQGTSTGNYTVTVSPLGGFTGSVNLAISATNPLPAGASASGFTTNTSTNTSTFTVNTGTAAGGTYSFGVTGTSGTLSRTATATLVIPTPDFSLSVSPSSQSVLPGGTSGTYKISVTPVNGFTGTPTFTFSAPSGITVNPTGSSFTATASSTTAAGSYTITVKGTSGTLSHTATATLVVSSTGTFSVSTTSSSLTVRRRSSGSVTVSVTGSGGFNGSVKLSVSGVPPRTSASFNPSSVTGSGSSTLTITPNQNAPTGTTTLTITGTSGSVTSSKTISLTIN
jgi:hypothetical protein